MHGVVLVFLNSSSRSFVALSFFFGGGEDSLVSTPLGELGTVCVGVREASSSLVNSKQIRVGTVKMSIPH